MDLEKSINEAIEKNDFYKLESLFTDSNFEEFEDHLIQITFENESLVCYTLVCMLLMKKETVKLHRFAVQLLAHPLCIITGAYAAALYHLKRAILLDPKNVELKEDLLFFHEVPDQLIGPEEAEKIANEILKKKPDSECARGVLSRLAAK